METLRKEIIRLSGLNVYCEYKLQDKPPIIFIHGFVSSVVTFRRMMPYLSRHYSVVALDLPGFGKSEKCTSFVYSYENYARLIARCMEYFKLEKAVLAGHSMGGQIALYTARLIPERVEKLILLASSGYLDKAKAWQRYATYLPFSELAAKYVVHKKTVPDYLKNVLYDHSFITDQLIEAYGAPLKEKKFYQALIRLLRYREGDLPAGELKRITTPALLIWGKEDRVVPFEIGKQLESDLPNARLICYDHSGHLLTEERPKTISEEILYFLKGKPSCQRSTSL